MYNVGQRKREIGIRMAVGARSGNVVALVMRQTFTLVASGVAAGICTAVVLGRMLESVSSKLLFGVAPHDPLILTAAAAAMVIVAAAAAYLPARAAAHVDPTVTLREE
jgi:ABC-type antimicrobial peptide transport system permease subunit